MTPELLAIWKEVVLEINPDGRRWKPIPDDLGYIGLVITAWNAKAQLLPRLENDRRDGLLFSSLRRMNLVGIRARGSNPVGSWYEQGWLIRHEEERSIELLLRYEQLAGFIIDGPRRQILMQTGKVLDVPPQIPKP